MIRFLLLFYLTLFQQAEPIKAISYNIRYNNPKDGINVWENRRETVASLLKEENADFVGFRKLKWRSKSILEKYFSDVFFNCVSASFLDRFLEGRTSKNQ